MGVQNFLLRLGLEKHEEMFVAKGFDSEDDLPYLQGEDLDVMYITDPNDRRKLLEAAPHFKPSKEFILYDWLRSKGLDHYFISFVQSELIDLPEIARLNLPDEELYDELEITLPGHKRRLERAVRSLAKKHRTTLPAVSTDTDDHESGDIPPSAPEPEVPVAYGKWGKPRCLLDAKYDFLLIDATVVSTLDPRDRVHIEFMVDSGSDVVTLRQEVLDTMDLELIGPIHSKGVHGSKVKNLYRANILIGDQAVEIEVMGETYDSIGSRVIRHFRHFISGNRHIWLKGDFIDPTLTPASSVKTEETVQLTVEMETTKSPVQESVLEKEERGEEENEEEEEGVKEMDSLDEEGGVLKEQENFIESAIADVEEEENVVVQKDHVKFNGNLDQAPVDKVNVNESLELGITFSFSKTAKVSQQKELTDITVVNHQNSSSHDETDKLLGSSDEIIDLRPIINANRKRHASNAVGFERLQNEKRSRKNKLTRKNERHKLQKTLKMDDSDVSRELDETKKLRTVLNQRSVYYRSQE